MQAIKVGVATVAALVVLVFAGLGRASYSVGYTGLVAAAGLVGFKNDSRELPRVARVLARLARGLGHPVVLVAVVGATAQDVAGYPHVPWCLAVACWCLAYWAGSHANFANGKSDELGFGCVALAVLAFVTGLAQFFDSA